MSLIGWSRKFERYEAITDIPDRVRKTEVVYWCSLIAGIALLLGGIGMMLQSSQSVFGLFVGLSGVVDIALIKLWAHIRLATYQIILELQARDKVQP